jgi:hypothetical protein
MEVVGVGKVGGLRYIRLAVRKSMRKSVRQRTSASVIRLQRDALRKLMSSRHV